MATKKEASKPGSPRITPLNMKIQLFVIEGVTQLVLNRFSEKAKAKMMADQASGTRARKVVNREPKDFDECYRGAMHLDVHSGWQGAAASAFRAASISACRLVNYKMTMAKLSIFVEADGYDSDSTPLVKIIKGEPEMSVLPARNDNGAIDLRARPLWQPGWRIALRVRYDADQFSQEEVINLLNRVGLQVGIGEGRYDSKNSPGIGWGCFKVIGVGPAEKFKIEEPRYYKIEELLSGIPDPTPVGIPG